jgi:D-aminopeptidase
MSPLFEAAMEAAEEAIYNALVAAVTIKGYRGTVEALPLDKLKAIIDRHGRTPQPR